MIVTSRANILIQEYAFIKKIYVFNTFFLNFKFKKNLIFFFFNFLLLEINAKLGS